MSKVNNDDLIRAIFAPIATEERKSRALLILQGEDIPLRIDEPLLLTMGQSAELLNVSRATLWRTIKAGRLPKVELYPGAFRLRRSDILAIVNGKAVRNG